MFEFEVSERKKIIDNSNIPLSQYYHPDNEANITHCSVLQWEEHCTECSMPHCFSTCDLYSPRKDGNCRRFVDGIRVVSSINVVQGYLASVSFKRWGSLMAKGQVNLVPIRIVRIIENIIKPLEKIAILFPDSNIKFKNRKGISSRLIRKVKNKLKLFCINKFSSSSQPDYFLIEVLSAKEGDTKISFVIRSTHPEKNKTPYQKLLHIKYGLNRVKVPFHEMKSNIMPSHKSFITITPNITNPGEDGIELVFGTIGFIKDANHNKNISKYKNDKNIKVLIWDLDNTLWDNILIEKGPANITLKKGAIETIKELDRRGIVNSVASKNNQLDVFNVFEKMGISEYFVFPKINWNPKSVSVKEIIQDFNVGSDAVAFIDDSEFEREEVLSINPSVRTYDASELSEILYKPEFNPEVTSDSIARSKYYKTQEKRNSVLNTFNGDYLDFIKNCQMCLEINTAELLHLDRIHELVQ